MHWEPILKDGVIINWQHAPGGGGSDPPGGTRAKPATGTFNFLGSGHAPNQAGAVPAAAHLEPLDPPSGFGTLTEPMH